MSVLITRSSLSGPTHDMVIQVRNFMGHLKYLICLTYPVPLAILSALD